MGKNVVFALNKTLELKAENENMLICRERERNWEWTLDRELVYVNDERMIFQPFNGYMVSLLLFEGWNSKKKKVRDITNCCRILEEHKYCSILNSTIDK